MARYVNLTYINTRLAALVSSLRRLSERAGDDPTGYVFTALTVLTVVMLLGAVLGKVDKVIDARGRTVSTVRNITVQPYSLSIVKEIKVKPGQMVQAGQVLVVLDPTVSDAEVGQLRSKVDGYGAEVRRLQAELASTWKYEAEGEWSKDDYIQEALLASRKTEYEANIAKYTGEVQEAEAGIQKRKNMLRVYEPRYKVNLQVENMYDRILQTSNSVSKVEWLKAVDTRLRLETDITSTRNEILEYQQKLAKANASLNAYRQEWRNKAYAQLVEQKIKYDEALQDLRKAEMSSQLVELKSPVDAAVLEIEKVSTGSVVREADVIMRLASADAPVEIQANVDSREIAYLEPGQPVRIKLDSLPFQKYGVLRGKVRSVSRDSFDDAEERNQGQTKNIDESDLYYTAQIEITERELVNIPSSFHLLPGMSLSADIRVGERRIIEYLLYPVLRGLDESIREP